MEHDLITLAATALLATHIEKSPHGLEPEKLNDAVIRAANAVQSGDTTPEELATLLEGLQKGPYSASGFVGYSRREVARWFEVELDEFDRTPLAQLEPEVLFRHLYYEKLFESWFREWDYEVKVGEDIGGQEDFVPDVWAESKTIHGDFEVAVTFFCDDPPNTFRVKSVLESLEGFAPKGSSEFGERDICLMVTPFKFLEKASRAIERQGSEEDYFVIEIEGDDLHALETAETTQSRIRRLRDLVESAADAKGLKVF